MKRAIFCCSGTARDQVLEKKDDTKSASSGMMEQGRVNGKFTHTRIIYYGRKTVACREQ